MRKSQLFQIISTLVLTVFVTVNLSAGNEQRGGSSGAQELLINPWAQSSGMGSANIGSVEGMEGLFMNIAGMAHVPRTEILFTNSQWFSGSGISINSFGFGQRVSEAGVLGISIMNINFGDIERTTTALPEGGIGTFSPSYTTIGLSYAREFSNSIYGGFSAKVLNESIHNLSASGFAIDMGIQYITGFGTDRAGNRHRDNIRFGITMQNIGTTMKYSGEGMSFFGQSTNGTDMTIEHRSQEFELPALIKIGFSYHLLLAQNIDSDRNVVYSDHELILAGGFTSHSFTRDQFHFGVEYGYSEIFYLRGGYIYEEGITSTNNRLTAFTGPTAGMTVYVPTNADGTGRIGIDYSYRLTNPFGGVHTFGARLNVGGDGSTAPRY